LFGQAESQFTGQVQEARLPNELPPGKIRWQGKWRASRRSLCSQQVLHPVSRLLEKAQRVEADDRPLSEAARDARPTRARIWCKNCKRKDFHYLNIHPPLWRNSVKVLTLGIIGFFGVYRCVCCGKRRIGRFDILRGPERPKRSERKSWRSSHESWKHVQRREQIKKFFLGLVRRRSRRRKHRHHHRKFH
jgi:hypothetical protein